MPRSKPFSGKQKKLQLQAKRQEKHLQGHHVGRATVSHYKSDDSSDDESSSSKIVAGSVSKPPASRNESHKKGATKSSRDRYRLTFSDENKEDPEARKQRAMQPYSRRSPEEMEADVELFYNPPIMFPVRPPWNRSLSPSQLESQEHHYFQKYCEDFLKHHSLGYVELNLETWRQLWRVLEMSDLLLIIIDVRYSPLHFNPALYEHINKTLDKRVIVVLNKCDIVPPSVAIAWKNYLLEQFPKLEVVVFTSFPKNEQTRESLTKGKQSRRLRKRPAAVGPLELWEVCNRIVNQDVNIQSWRTKILEDMKSQNGEDSDSDQSDCEVERETEIKFRPDLEYSEHKRYKDGVLTIGCVGYPNVGKSSVINGLMGKKVVSISRTPGHTKHFQTIFLTNNVRLCDCPGLVFPSTAPRAVQVLAGMYPVAQLREPYSVVQYLAERSDLPASVGLRPPHPGHKWSAYDICDELAELKGFKTGRGARTDSYRAANWILRAALEGKVLSYLLPPAYNARKEYWASHPETGVLLDLQLKRLAVAEGQGSEVMRSEVAESEESSDTDDSEEGSATSCSNAYTLLAHD